MTAIADIARGLSSRALWFGNWFSLCALCAVLALDARQRQVPLVVLVIWFLPLVVFVPGMLRDHLRSFAWLSFVTLLYFVSGVQRVFAEPSSPRALVELGSVIALFLCSMLYIRERGREVRAVRERVSEE